MGNRGVNALSGPRSPPTPLADEAVRLVDHRYKLVRAPFTDLDLVWARESVQRNGGVGLLALRGRIGHRPGFGTTAYALLRQMDLLRAAGARALLIQVDSEGGDVQNGLAIVRGVSRGSKTGTPVIAWVSGRADSMASGIVVAADYAVIDPVRGSMLLHDPEGGTDEHREILRGMLLDQYEARTLVDRGTLAGYMSGRVTLDPQASWQNGFVDEVANAERVADIARAAAQPGALWNAAIRDAGSCRRLVLSSRRAAASG